MNPTTAELFDIDGSQAVRLPAAFRFDGTDEVYIHRDEGTGDVILSTRSFTDWHAFMVLREGLGPLPDGFPRDRAQGAQRHDPFEG